MIAALRIITVSVPVVDVELATVPKHQREANAMTTPVNVGAVLELPVVTVNVAPLDSGTTTEVDANLATVTKNSPSVSDVIPRPVSALVSPVLSVTSANLVRIDGYWSKARAVSNAIPARITY